MQQPFGVVSIGQTALRVQRICFASWHHKRASLLGSPGNKQTRSYLETILKAVALTGSQQFLLITAKTESQISWLTAFCWH